MRRPTPWRAFTEFGGRDVREDLGGFDGCSSGLESVFTNASINRLRVRMLLEFTDDSLALVSQECLLE
jgi:hypothetical protein